MPFQPFDLAGKVALVTGGNGGIGFGMAEGLAKSGADVVIWGTNRDKNASAVERLSLHGTRIASQVVDVSDEALVESAMSELISDFGHLDTCIANAGVGRGRGPFHEISTTDYRYVLAVNLDGHFFTLRAAARHMLERAREGPGGGSLVGVSSVSALMGAAQSAHYGASKGAIVSMMKALAVEYARFGIRANSVVPGWIRTDLTQAAFESPVVQEKVLRRIPVRRWGAPDDFAGIAIYLASDASSYLTGQEIVICGGYTVF